VGNSAVILQNVVVRDALRKSDPFGERQNVMKILVWQFMQLLCVI
jgi:hypothetical protein